MRPQQKAAGNNGAQNTGRLDRERERRRRKERIFCALCTELQKLNVLSLEMRKVIGINI
jgi:hypothetical protein